jgi:ribonucleoside-diphosphate reductase alpha chain
VLEISVAMAQFPSKEVARNSFDFRTLGLGYANLGSLIMVSGIAYDSEQARAMAAAITAIMTGTSYATSAELASVLGPFSKYKENKKHMLRVIRNHRYAAYHAEDAFEGLEIKPQSIDAKKCPRRKARLQECTGNLHCSHRHDRTANGLRYYRGGT